jgi:signal peptidase I
VALGQFGVASPFTVPMDGYFVLGDNSANANDSRFWGALPRTNILGKVKNK